jgi:hypothetical protein
MLIGMVLETATRFAADLLGLFVFLPEPVNPPGGVHETLLAREKRVTVGTNLHLKIAVFGGHHFTGIPARAGNHGDIRLRMQIFFHSALHVLFRIGQYSYFPSLWQVSLPMRAEMSMR